METFQRLNPNYRPDIDGLRAIAVLSVVTFHAFPNLMAGGFVGVDVFFVISGYLISKIIFESIKSGMFSFAEFYARRIKRIFPALLIVLVVCFCVGWFVLASDEYKQLGKHIAGGAGFVSNFILWNESGYFDASANRKPLLHLWSLGVEEQFYFLWPFVVWVVFKLGLNPLIISTLIAIISFYINLNLTDSDRAAAFYLPQARFWELMLGTLLAWVNLGYSEWINFFSTKLRNLFRHSQKNTNPIDEYDSMISSVVSLVGVVLLTHSFCNIDKGDDFPGLLVLFPVFGAFLIILAGPKAWFNRVVLSHKGAVWIGLISYPLYLWHWPFLSLARIIKGEESLGVLGLVIVFASFGVSWATYQFIEKPIRFGPRGKEKTIALVLLMISIGLVGYSAFEKQGYEFRAINKVNHFNNTLLGWDSIKTVGCESKLNTDAHFCLELGNKNNETIAVLGDSTANALAPGLYDIYLSNTNEGLLNIGSPGCAPIRGLEPNQSWGAPNSSKGRNCVEAIKKAFSYILDSSKIQTVVLGIFARDLPLWGMPGLPPSDLKGRFLFVKSLLDKDIRELIEAGKRVIVTYDMPFYPMDARSCLSRLRSKGNSKKICSVPESQLIDRLPFVELFNSYFKSNLQVCVVNSSNVLIKNHFAEFFDKDGILMIRDDHHLSYHGSRLVAKEFENQGCIVRP